MFITTKTCRVRPSRTGSEDLCLGRSQGIYSLHTRNACAGACGWFTCAFKPLNLSSNSHLTLTARAHTRTPPPGLANTPSTRYVCSPDGQLLATCRGVRYSLLSPSTITSCRLCASLFYTIIFHMQVRSIMANSAARGPPAGRLVLFVCPAPAAASP